MLARQAVDATSMVFRRALIERAMDAELSHLLRFAPKEVGNVRNGTSGKTVLADDGPLRIEVPRDRDCDDAG